MNHIDIWAKIKDDFKDKYEYTNKLIQSMVSEVFKISIFSTKTVHRVVWLCYDKHLK